MNAVILSIVDQSGNFRINAENIVQKENMMKCIECGHEAPLKEFRYLYNARIDASISIRQCINCSEWLAVDEMKGVVTQKVSEGESPWGKSAGIEGLAHDV